MAKKKWSTLTFEDRKYIESVYKTLNTPAISRNIGCARSTISRELHKRSINGVYSAEKAQESSNKSLKRSAENSPWLPNNERKSLVERIENLEMLVEVLTKCVTNLERKLNGSIKE